MDDIDKIISKALHPSRNPEMVRRWLTEEQSSRFPNMDETITITLDRAAAEHLAVAWENDWPLTTPVRVLFDGQDGFLHALNEALGREH